MLQYFISYAIVFLLFFFFSYGIIYSTDFPKLSLDFIGFSFGGPGEDKNRLKRFLPVFSPSLTRDNSSEAIELISLHQEFTDKVLSFKEQIPKNDAGLTKIVIMLVRFIPVGVGIPLCIVQSPPLETRLFRVGVFIAPLILGTLAYFLADRIYAVRGTSYWFESRSPDDFVSEYHFSYEQACKKILSEAYVNENAHFYNAFFYFIETKYVELLNVLLPKIADRQKIFIALRAASLPVSIYFLIKFSFYFFD